MKLRYWRTHNIGQSHFSSRSVGRHISWRKTSAHATGPCISAYMFTLISKRVECASRATLSLVSTIYEKTFFETPGTLHCVYSTIRLYLRDSFHQHSFYLRTDAVIWAVFAAIQIAHLLCTVSRKPMFTNNCIQDMYTIFGQLVYSVIVPHYRRKFHSKIFSFLM